MVSLIISIYHSRNLKHFRSICLLSVSKSSKLVDFRHCQSISSKQATANLNGTMQAVKRCRRSRLTVTSSWYKLSRIIQRFAVNLNRSFVIYRFVLEAKTIDLSQTCHRSVKSCVCKANVLRNEMLFRTLYFAFK